MRLLNWNQRMARHLGPLEIRRFIAGRVWVGFGCGILARACCSRSAHSPAIPLVAVGLLFALMASKEFARKDPVPSQ